jgi:hypothetical protein
MEIYIEHSSFGILPLQVENSNTISQVKQIIDNKTKLPCSKQKLICGKQILQDVCSLHQCGIQGDSLLYLQLNNHCLNISVRILSKDIIKLEGISTSLTVQDLKSRIEEKYGIFNREGQLTLNGTQLQDNLQLSDCKIHDRSPVFWPVHLHEIMRPI